MKALSIRQPWAWLIVNGYKDIENRSWITKFRGKFLVHASLTMTKQEFYAAQQFIYDVCWKIPLPNNRNEFQFGGIIGEVELVDCVGPEKTNSSWFEGPYGFVLKNPKILPFRPLRGQQGFFNVS